MRNESAPARPSARRSRRLAPGDRSRNAVKSTGYAARPARWVHARARSVTRPACVGCGTYPTPVAPRARVWAAAALGRRWAPGKTSHLARACGLRRRPGSTVQRTSASHLARACGRRATCARSRSPARLSAFAIRRSTLARGPPSKRSGTSRARSASGATATPR